MWNFFRTRRGVSLCVAALSLCLLAALPAAARAQTPDAQTLFDQIRQEVDKEGVPLTLREAVALALDSNLAIAVRRYDPTMATNDVLFQQGVFDPSLNLFAQTGESTIPQRQASIAGALVLDVDNRFSSIRYDDPTAVGGLFSVVLSSNRRATNSAPGVSNVNPSYDTALTFTYDQSLLRNFGYDVNTTGVRIARRDVTISQSAFRQTVQDTILGTERAYWDLKFAREDLVVKRTSLALSAETLKQNQIRVEVGTMAPIDVTTAEAEVAQRQLAVLQAENDLENAEDLLRLVLNQPQDSSVWLLDINPSDELPFDQTFQINLQDAIETAYDRRPDLEQQRLRIENDSDNVRFNRNQLRYDLDLRAQYGKTALGGDFFGPDPSLPPPGLPFILREETSLTDALGDLFSEEFDNWLISLNYNIRFNNKAARASYLNARLGQEQRVEAYDSLELDAAIEVRNRVRAVQNTIQRVDAGRVNVRLQRERLDAENKRYENGMTTTFDLFLFQDRLTQAASEVFLALVDYNKARAELEATQGTLNEYHGVHEATLLAMEPVNPDLP